MKPPASLARLKRGVRSSIAATYDPLEGPAEPWATAQDIVGGAGLLMREGRDVDDWSGRGVQQGLRGRTPSADDDRHDANGTIWLVTVDGRQPALSVGMTLVELRALARASGLVNALNLDGGGSTTMWVQGAGGEQPVGCGWTAQGQ